MPSTAARTIKRMRIDVSVTSLEVYENILSFDLR